MRTDHSDHPNSGHASSVESDGSAEAARPGWFRKRAPVAERSQPPPLPRNAHPRKSKISIEVGEEEELSWHQRLMRSVLGFAGLGYASSFLFHLLLLIVASLIILKEVVPVPGSLQASHSEGADTEFDEILDTRLDLDGGAQETVETPALQVFPEMQNEPPRPTLSADELSKSVESGQGVGLGSGDGAGDGSGGNLLIPKGAKSVTKGSFTAWTVPEDPLPGQPYLIIIQIQLPEKVRRYGVADLSGEVQGTDGYAQVIPLDPHRRRATMTLRDGKPIPVTSRRALPIYDNRAQLMIEVPGAENLVKDTIEIESRMLKERQTLELVFQEKRPERDNQGDSSFDSLFELLED